MHESGLARRDSPPGVLDLTRGAGFRCVVDLSDAPVPLTRDWALLLASDPATSDALAPDTAAWLAFGHGP